MNCLHRLKGGAHVVPHSGQPQGRLPGGPTSWMRKVLRWLCVATDIC